MADLDYQAVCSKATDLRRKTAGSFVDEVRPMIPPHSAGDDPNDPRPHYLDRMGREAWDERRKERETAWLLTAAGIAWTNERGAHEASLRSKIATVERQRASAAADELADACSIPRMRGTRRRVIGDGLNDTRATAAAEAAVKAWQAADTGIVVVLTGGVGCGKSIAISRQVFLGGGLYVLADTVATTARSGYSTNMDTWAKWIAAEVLAIDEMGEIAGSKPLVRDLLARRWDDGGLTLCASNWSGDKIITGYEFGDPLLDRITSQGTRWAVDVNAESMR